MRTYFRIQSFLLYFLFCEELVEEGGIKLDIEIYVSITQNDYQY